MAFAMFARTGRAPEGDSAATVVHADLDAFLRVRRTTARPAPAEQADCGRGGGVLAASYEARAFGIRSYMPRRVRQLCPDLVFFSGQFDEHQRLGDAPSPSWAIHAFHQAPLHRPALRRRCRVEHRYGSPTVLCALLRSRLDGGRPPRTIRQKRTKTEVETRIEHAEVCWREALISGARRDHSHVASGPDAT
jgi:hypothetical protein